LEDYDPFDKVEDEDPGEEQVDPKVEDVKPKILEVLRKVSVATDRELKVRLEKSYFPWVVGRALGILIGEGEVQKVGYPGRRAIRRSEVGAFYTLKEVEYNSIKDLIKRKKAVSEAIVSALGGGSSASDHVEDLFLDAFRRLDFKFHGRDVSKFQGREVSHVRGKEASNVDFVLERDKVAYGIDVKNWIRYEWDYRDEIASKVDVAQQLGVVPFIIARYADKDIMWKGVIKKGGMVYRYNSLLLPSFYRSLAVKARDLLAYPVSAVDELPTYKTGWLEKLHSRFVEGQ
jgi:hypothetical protein